MGFWNWLTGKSKSVEAADVIWLTADAKRAGVLAALRQELDSAALVLAVAHFSATLVQLTEDCAAAGFPHVIHDGALKTGDLKRLADASQPRILLTRAETLVVDEFPADVVENAPALPIIVVERHFLRAHDERATAFAAGMGRCCRVSYHVSLDDPLMRRFAGEWVQGVLARLGMKESEAIESAMVARRVKAAQARFAKLNAEERRTDSPDDWLRLNAPGAE